VDSHRVIRHPVERSPLLDIELAHLLAAIELVARRVAVRVVVTGVSGIDGIGEDALAAAQAARVRFAVVRGAGSVRVVLGPLEE
jgi:hypothetical protein